MREGWQAKRLGECFNLKSGDGLTKKAMVEGQFPVYGGNGIVGTHNKSNLSGENVIVGRVGALCGNVRHITKEIWLTDNAFQVVGFESEFSADFLTYLLNEKKLRGLARHAAQPVISNSSLKNLVLRFPESKIEQKRIVAILDEAFAAIATATANTEKNIKNAKELFESYLGTVFSDSLFGELVSIGDVGTVFDGPHATPKTVDSGPIFLGIKSLDKGSLDLSTTRHVTRKDFEKWTRRVTPQTDDVVFSYETKLGSAATIPKGLECCLGRRMAIVRLDQKRVDPQFFLFQYLSPAFQRYLSERFVQGATVDRIPLKEFPTYKIRVPTMKQQLVAVSKIEAVSNSSRFLGKCTQEKLRRISTLKQSILHKAFTGELTSDHKAVDSKLKEAGV